eukprot:CAMPEP_0115858504 /NCGR_PEP_ID=MMETSP0287-20121206/16133_1 /TAXON_ID=412157 /ORGANISM="Chrysochromulina rotalis, Strain UIO044" /LENGTH=107 /DNA_ID=CAMNT_0003312773 /DNA_START=223 /DNA_END=547 /DNA_ORIENTATION=+
MLRGYRADLARRHDAGEAHDRVAALPANAALTDRTAGASCRRGGQEVAVAAIGRGSRCEVDGDTSLEHGGAIGKLCLGCRAVRADHATIQCAGGLKAAVIGATVALA